MKTSYIDVFSKEGVGDLSSTHVDRWVVGDLVSSNRELYRVKQVRQERSYIVTNGQVYPTRLGGKKRAGS